MTQTQREYKTLGVYLTQGIVTIKKDGNVLLKLGMANAINRIEIHDELVSLLENIYERLEGQEDIIDGGNGKQLPNVAMSIRMDIKSVLANV